MPLYFLQPIIFVQRSMNTVVDSLKLFKYIRGKKKLPDFFRVLDLVDFGLVFSA